MTTQLQDSLSYQGEAFEVREGLFSPWEHGISPGSDSSGCWRGYVAFYAIRDGLLVLTNLSLADPEQPLAFDEDGNEIQERASYPALNGVTAIRDTAFMEGNWHYREVDLPLDYSGTLTLCRLPRHLDVPDYWEGLDNPDEEDFEHVLRLTLEKGRVIAEEVVRVPQDRPQDESSVSQFFEPAPVDPDALPQVNHGTADLDEDFLKEWGDFLLPDDDKK